MQSLTPQLKGQQVAFTGRLASLTRPQAAQLVSERGGQVSGSVTTSTTLLVVGQEGWPLQQDGRLTRKLIQARARQRAGQSLEIIPEHVFLERLDLRQTNADTFRRYTTAELTQLLGIPRDMVRSWIRAGLLQPVEQTGDLQYFDFQQINQARSLTRMVQSGVSSRRIQRTLQQLRSWLPEADAALQRLNIDGQRVFVRNSAGQCVEPTGQMLLDWDDVAEPDQPELIRADRPVDHFQLALQAEATGNFEQAVDSYRRLLEQDGPDPDVCFNLANVLYTLGQPEAAAERLHQTVELDSGYAEAWNNLGNILSELGRLAEGISAFQQALQIDPDYADVHYNLAESLDEAGQIPAAIPHWQAYLRYETAGEWADYARQRLNEESA